MDDFNDSDALDDAPPSKSQRKREMHALRDLAERITGLGKGKRKGQLYVMDDNGYSFRIDAACASAVYELKPASSKA